MDRALLSALENLSPLSSQPSLLLLFFFLLFPFSAREAPSRPPSTLKILRGASVWTRSVTRDGDIRGGPLALKTNRKLKNKRPTEWTGLLARTPRNFPRRKVRRDRMPAAMLVEGKSGDGERLFDGHSIRAAPPRTSGEIRERRLRETESRRNSSLFDCVDS